MTKVSQPPSGAARRASAAADALTQRAVGTCLKRHSVASGKSMHGTVEAAITRYIDAEDERDQASRGRRSARIESI